MAGLEHRRARATLRVFAPDGTPAANTDITFDQTRHAFLFGCGAFEAVELAGCGDERRRLFLEDRLSKILELCNFATLPFYWGTYEPEEGKTRAETLRDGATWLKERGVTVKGHPLCWHTVCADWLLEYSNREIWERQMARIRREVAGFRGLIDIWDSINEVVIMPNFDKYDNAVTRLCREWGRVGLTRAVFEEAVSANPEGLFLINDFNVSPEYERLIEGLLEAGVPIGAIGIQSHQHQGYWGLEKLGEVLERFSRFGLPLHFTENTLLSGMLTPPEYDDLNDFAPVPWPSTPEGEARQAEQAAEFYTALFEHPQVSAITNWSPADDGWLNAPGGLLTAENAPKPVYRALHGLIHGKWETHAALRTDENGVVTLEGFKGDYAVMTGSGTATLSLAGDGEQAIKLERK